MSYADELFGFYRACCALSLSLSLPALSPPTLRLAPSLAVAKAYFPLPDRDGRPIYIERTGIIDVDSMVLLTDLDRLVNYHIWCMERHMRERFIANSQSSGRPITSLITIMDMVRARGSLSLSDVLTLFAVPHGSKE